VVSMVPFIAFAAAGAPAALFAATAARELECRFDTACVDGRPCFASDATIRVVFRDDGLAELHFADQPARLAGIEVTPRGITLVTDPDLGRVEVLDISTNGQANFVQAQDSEAVEMLSRTGHCVKPSANSGAAQ
jgi:hypothetical protein